MPRLGAKTLRAAPQPSGRNYEVEQFDTSENGGALEHITQSAHRQAFVTLNGSSLDGVYLQNPPESGEESASTRAN